MYNRYYRGGALYQVRYFLDVLESVVLTVLQRLSLILFSEGTASGP